MVQYIYKLKGYLISILKVVTLDIKKNRSYDSERVNDNVVKKKSEQEKSLLMTIDNVYQFYIFRLSAELYAEFTNSLDVAPQNFPYICRAQFMRSLGCN
jgi:hypothetical protein